MPDSYTDDEQQLLDLAYVYALDAVSEAERSDIAGRLGVAAPHTAQAFARSEAARRPVSQEPRSPAAAARRGNT